VARLGGRLDTWRRLLARFVDDLDTQSAQLRELATSGRGDDAARLAHTMKGVAATLGAGAIARAAGEAESALREAAGVEPSSMRLLGASAGLLDAIDAAVPALRRLCEAADGAPAGAGAVDDTGVREAADTLAADLQRLAALLVDADMEALPALDRLRAHGAPRHSRFERLDDAVTRLDFDAALVACRDWLQEIGA
jgi:two-component system sensor histidine kinase/response regulator